MASTQTAFAEYLSVMLISLFFLVIYIIRLYGNPKNFPWHSYITIFLAYYCSLALLLFVPLDVSLTVVSRRSTRLSKSYDENSSTLETMYLIVYVPVAVLSGFLMLVQEQYLRDGHFTFTGKIIGVFKMMAMQMVAGMVFGAIFFGVLVGEGVVKANGEAVLLTVVLISNTCYLMVMTLFIGYGLVALPLHLWEKGSLTRTLNVMEQKAAARYKTLGETSINVGLAVADVMKTKAEVATYNDPYLQECMDVLVHECPANFTSQTMGKVAYEGNSRKVTENSLALLRGRLTRLTNDYEMAHGKVEEAKITAYHYEDIIAAVHREDGIRKINWSFRPEGSEFEYMYEVWYKPLLFRFLGVVSAVLSVFSYLGIIGTMPGVTRDLSVYYLAVHDDMATGGGITVFVLFTLVYTAYVVLWSIFQMRIAHMMELLPNQKTTPNSLSVNARACTKFAAPLSFFYLGWIFENGTKAGAWTNGSDGKVMLTAFANFYQVQLIPVIGDKFNVIFPIVIFSVSFLVVTNLINRFLVMIKLENFQFGSEILTPQQLAEGRRQLTRHKRLMERSARRASLRKHINTATGGAAVVAAISEPVKHIFSVFFCCKKLQDYEETDMRDAELGDDDMDDIVPKVLMGWCERKESKSRGFGTGAWHRRYLYVSEPGTLQFFKDAEMDKEMDDPLDLRDATEFEPQQGKDRGTHMNILLQDGEIKLRFQHEEDVHLWKEGLAAWRAYSMEHESLHDGSGGLDGIVITGLDTDEVVNPLTPPKGSPIQANRKGPMAMPSPPKTSSAPSKDKAEYAATVSRGDDFELVRLESGEMNLSSAPDPMNGWLEKKTHHTGKMGKWQKKYFRISDSGILSYASSDKEDLHTSQIDLKLVVDIILLEEKGPDSGRFNIVMDDRVFKIKAPSAASAASWVEGLKAWQEYLLFNM